MESVNRRQDEERPKSDISRACTLCNQAEILGGQSRGEGRGGVLTNRRSRAPCKTDALIVEAFELTGRCIGAGSSVAEGAILMG
jgi:hypothetical protein